MFENVQCLPHIMLIWQLLGRDITLRVKHQMLVHLVGLLSSVLFRLSKKMWRMLCFTVDVVGLSFVWIFAAILQFNQLPKHTSGACITVVDAERYIKKVIRAYAALLPFYRNGEIQGWTFVRIQCFLTLGSKTMYWMFTLVL